MQCFTEKEILALIEKKKPFTAEIDSGAFTIKIDRYVPTVCTAIHNGHNVDPAFEPLLLPDAMARKFEEDPHTGDMLVSFPIVLTGLHSRFQYDLNRAPEECIYETAWGKNVWRRPLRREERATCTALHNSYYRVLHALLTVLESCFQRCIIYDLHSYNAGRIGEDAPLFNIGTHYIRRKRYQSVLTELEQSLSAATFPGITNRVALDEVFYGKGYQASYIHHTHPNSLCIPLEIKKTFMDEPSCEPYPLILDSITVNLEQVLGAHASLFHRQPMDNRSEKKK
jgi:N-formylglutamate amidohydrolase